MPHFVYIHIPFCKSRCNYCSFVSSEKIDRQDEYVTALSKEINFYYKGENLKTIYLGGGTPSILDIKYIQKILSRFIYIPDFCEITLEMNPDDADMNYLRELRKLGVNRISIGAQTFNENILKIIGRRHNSEQTLNAVETAKKAGFKNISLDFMYGLPEQTQETLAKDLEIATELDVQHISTYGLKIEPPSSFYKHQPENLPDSDTQADMYIYINEYLKTKGFKRYEISNFAKAGFESKNNLNYWNNKEYYGFGASAHGYRGGIRYSNWNNIDEYIKHPLKKESEHFVTPKEKYEEEIFLGFRRENGIDTKYIKEKYYIDFEDKYKQILEKFSPEYIEKTDNGYKLTTQGVLISNIILSEFIEE